MLDLCKAEQKRAFVLVLRQVEGQSINTYQVLYFINRRGKDAALKMEKSRKS